MDAGALDDLDLDDMFADDGDMLFDGLDLGLDDPAMGGISNDTSINLAPTIEAPVAAPGPKTKRPGGPRTKRTNPMLEKASKIKEEPTAPGNKRRKTKRKSKAPTAYGDDEDEFIEEELPTRKKRKVTTKAKNVVPVATAKPKRRKKGETLANSAIPGLNAVGAPKASLVAPSSVAASGQFGGRLKKAGTTKVKRKLKKSNDGSFENFAADPPILIKPPKPESTFGGLHPSRTLFYPFLESVPTESTMQKRKTYPVMDRISSALTSQLLADPPKPQDSAVGISKESAVFKLMHDTYELSEKDKKNFTPEKQAALLRGISQLRKLVRKTDKNNLVKDVFAMCGLLTREYNFLKQTLENMKTWCKNEFDEDKYKETYEPPIEKPKITKWKCATGIVKVKIICTGFKEPKGSMQLYAMLPAIVFDVPTARPLLPSGVTSKGFATNKGFPMSNAMATNAKLAAASLIKKKTKGKVPDKLKAKGVLPSSQSPASPVPKTYADSAPLARRQQIIERVSQLALELENLMQKEKTFGKLDPIPEEQPPLHTTRMWDWLQSAGFYNKTVSSKILASLKSPKLHSRILYQSIPRLTQGRATNMETTESVSSMSLFDRLQSILVEVSDNDTNDDEEDTDEDSLAFLDDDDDEDETIRRDEIKLEAVINGDICTDPKVDIADLSELSIEERAFVHLSKAGLIKKSLYPSSILTVSSNTNEGYAAEDLGDVIEAMSTDLTKMTSMNNSRISFIERLTSEADIYYNKQVEDEQAVLIAKCQNLMKRTKEKAKKAKQKKDENLNLPW